MRYFKGILLSIIGLIVLVAAIQNYQAFSTSVQFRLNILVFKAETPSLSIFMISIICFLLGVVVTAMFGIADNLRLRKKLRDATRAQASSVQTSFEQKSTQSTQQ